MRTAKLSEVKDQLSRYVDLVRHGETVRILVRRVPVADLVPVEAARDTKGFDPEEAAQLEREGILRKGRAGWPRELDSPGPRVRGNAAIAAVVRDRREGR